MFAGRRVQGPTWCHTLCLTSADGTRGPGGEWGVLGGDPCASSQGLEREPRAGGESEKVSLGLKSESNYWGNHGLLQNEDRSRGDAQEPVVGSKEGT